MFPIVVDAVIDSTVATPVDEACVTLITATELDVLGVDGAETAESTAVVCQVVPVLLAVADIIAEEVPAAVVSVVLPAVASVTTILKVPLAVLSAIPVRLFAEAAVKALTIIENE